MKVILLQDIARIGRRFEIKDVPTGHALNMLIPKGIAQAATPANIKRIEAQKDKINNERKESDAVFDDALQKLKDIVVTGEVNANEQGHMCQALKSAVVADAFEKESISITESQIIIENAIKEVGEHTLELQSGDQKMSVKVMVVAKK